MHSPTPRGRATAPRPPYPATHGVIGERTGPNAKLCEQGASKRALPGTGYVARSPRLRAIIRNGNPNTIQQRTVHERIHLLLYQGGSAVPLYMVDGWVGCCTCCCSTYCCTRALVYMVDADGWVGRWVDGLTRFWLFHWCCSVPQVG